LAAPSDNVELDVAHALNEVIGSRALERLAVGRRAGQRKEMPVNDVNPIDTLRDMM